MVEKFNKVLNKIIFLRKENKSIPNELLTEFNDLCLELNDVKNKGTTLKEIYKFKNNDNKMFFTYYYLNILKLLDLNFQNINTLLQEIPDDLIQDYLFSILKSDEKREYLIQNKHLNINLIEKEIKAYDKKFIRFLLSNYECLKKLEDDSLEIPLNIFNKYIDITKLSLPLLAKIKKDNLASFINYKYSKTENLNVLLTKNKNLLEYIPAQSLILKNTSKKDIKELLKNNINILPKLDAVVILNYLEFYDLAEIIFYPNINADTISFINELKIILGNKDESYNIMYFINDSKDHSLIIYPFYEKNYENFKDIIKDYTYLQKFSYEIIEMVINSYYSSYEKVDLLRNKEIILDLPATTLTNILNTLNLRTVLNLIQNKDLLKKVDNLNCSVEKLDKSLIAVLLDEPMIVEKSSEELVFTSLSMLSDTLIRKYLSYPYIKEKLSLNSFLSLASNAKIKVNDLVYKYEINTYEENISLWVKDYINQIFKNNPSFSFINSALELQLIFNLDNETLKKINISEFRYLYEMITTKGNLKNGNVEVTYAHIKALLTCYLMLGFEKSTRLINTGSTLILWEDIENLKKICKKRKILDYKIDNELIFANLTNKMAANLQDMSVMFQSDESKVDFDTLIYNYPYVKNIVKLMNDEGYSSIKHSLNTLERYISYYNINSLTANTILQNYCDGFIAYLIDKESKKVDKLFLSKLDKTLLISNDTYKSYLVKSKNEFLNTYRFKLFTYLLSKKLTDKDTHLFKKKDIAGVLMSYQKNVLNDVPEMINLNHIINIFNAYCKNELDIISYLKNMGLYTPLGYFEYHEMLEEENIIKKINSFIIKNFDKTDIRMQVMNDILYHNLSYKYPNNLLKKIREYQNILENFLGSVYIDKSKMMLNYEKGVILGEEKDILEYDKVVNYINELITKTKKFIKNIFDEEEILKRYKTDYLNYQKQVKQNYELNKKNFTILQTSFDLDNILNIFKNVELNDYTLDKKDMDFLFTRKNIYLAGLGLSEIFNVSFGSILNNLKALKAIYEESKIDYQTMDLENAATLSLYLDTEEEVDILNPKFHKEAYTQAHMISSSIPYISKVHNNIAYKVLDKQSLDLKKFNKDIVLNNDTCIIRITDCVTNEALAYVYGFRIGNSLVIDCTHIEDEEILKTIDVCGESILEKTRFVNGTEAIDFLILRGKDIPGGIRIKENDTPLYYEFMNKYQAYKFSINDLYVTKSYKEIKPQNFLDYTPIEGYLRRRGKVIALSGVTAISELAKPKQILKLYALENGLSYTELENTLKAYKQMYVGDDWLIIITQNNQLYYYMVGEDDRKETEINNYLIKIGRDDINVRDNHRLYRLR